MFIIMDQDGEIMNQFGGIINFIFNEKILSIN